MSSLTFTEVLTHLHVCIMKSCMLEALYYVYVPCFLHRHASATEMGLQHTCDIPLCQSMDGSLHGMLATYTETFRMYADIISRGVYAKCNLQIICKWFAIMAGCLLVFTHS